MPLACKSSNAPSGPRFCIHIVNDSINNMRNRKKVVATGKNLRRLSLSGGYYIMLEMMLGQEDLMNLPTEFEK